LIDKNNPIPLYYQIKNDGFNDIELYGRPIVHRHQVCFPPEDFRSGTNLLEIQSRMPVSMVLVSQTAKSLSPKFFRMPDYQG